MPGIYLHIPFCKQACHYCNFHFSTSLKQKDALLEVMLRELEWRREELQGEEVQTIYLGGGTPSLLDESELRRLFDAIYKWYPVAPGAEVTLEANPDDLTAAKLEVLRHTPVNRLSIGVQSFAEADLRLMNRAHNAVEARTCIEQALAAGFSNLTVDLIYGSPTTSDAQWEINVRTLTDLGIPHLSCYCLTVEPKTALDFFVQKGKTPPVDEEQASRQFEMLMDIMEAEGYEHYEISNFARPGFYSRHNASYWQGATYLGIGPSAHSFDGRQRKWNVANNAKYIKSLLSIAPTTEISRLEGDLFEKETLTAAQRYNEYVMISLRTSWGCRLDVIRTLGPQFEQLFMGGIRDFILQGAVQQEGEVFRLTRPGKLIADRIAMELFDV
ncbi:MAG: radical SAM family heme chaperone HemW [Saprospiraceae bacterium]|nr:radical SAM family heme chaperone HemW [Saprospiraceae bacterium]